MSEYTSNDQSVGMDLSVEDTSHLVQAQSVLCIVRKVERQNTKNGKQPIMVQLEVISDGIDKGKVIFDRIFDKAGDTNNGEAMNKRRLRSLGLALGLTKINHTSDLMLPNKVIQVEVTIQHNAEYGSSNMVRSYSAVNSGGYTPTMTAPSMTAPTIAPPIPNSPIPNVAPPIQGQNNDPDVF